MLFPKGGNEEPESSPQDDRVGDGAQGQLGGSRTQARASRRRAVLASQGIACADRAARGTGARGRVCPVNSLT